MCVCVCLQEQQDYWYKQHLQNLQKLKNEKAKQGSTDTSSKGSLDTPPVPPPLNEAPPPPPPKEEPPPPPPPDDKVIIIIIIQLHCITSLFLYCTDIKCSYMHDNDFTSCLSVILSPAWWSVQIRQRQQGCSSCRQQQHSGSRFSTTERATSTKP